MESPIIVNECVCVIVIEFGVIKPKPETNHYPSDDCVTSQKAKPPQSSGDGDYHRFFCVTVFLVLKGFCPTPIMFVVLEGFCPKEVLSMHHPDKIWIGIKPDS